MPLIPSYLARLRTHSQSTAATSSTQSASRSSSTGGPATPGPEFARLPSEPPAISGNVAHQAPQVQIARKIHPDLGALLDENTAADNAVEAVGPPPPRRRSRGQLASKQPTAALLRETEDEDAQEAVIQTPKTGPDDLDGTSSPRSQFLSRILSAPILSGVRSTPSISVNTDPESEPGGLSTHWSTFGRRRVRMPQISEFGSLHRRSSGSKSSVQSKSSKLQQQQTSATATPSPTHAPSQVRTTASINDTSPSQTHSPSGTVSSSSGSKSYSLHSPSVRSKRHPQTYPQPIPDNEMASISPQSPAQVSLEDTFISPNSSIPTILSPRPTRPHLDDSAQTFGRGTPRQRDLTQKTLPELGDAFRPPVTSTPPLPQHQPPRSIREPPWTYPTRLRKKSSGSRSSTISFPSLPTWPFGSEPRPRAEDIFRHGNEDRRSGALGERSRLESFLSGRGDDVARRTSADWSAAEAVKDGNTGEGETWPATVSREMVILSLGDHGRALPVPVSSGEIAVEVGEVGTLREVDTKNPTLFGSTGEERRQFFRTARRWMTSRASVPADAPSSTPEQSSSHPPIITMTSSDPPASGSKSPVDSSQAPSGGGLIPFVSVTGPTPTTSPRHSAAGPDAGPSGSRGSPNDNISLMASGKRKKDVESEDESQPNEPGIRSILMRRKENSTRTSDASHAPSSFRHAKRIRLSTPSHSPPYDSQSMHQSPSGSPAGSRPPSSLRVRSSNSINSRTFSQSSIPLRAIVSPKPPSVDQGSTYHMRDPDLPPPRRLSTQWTGGARKDKELGRVFPLQGWAFIIGFLVFPLWWVAAAAPIGWGWPRRVVEEHQEKGALSEEELIAREVIKYDVAVTWRRRCRLMSLLGFLVYIPLIVLLIVLIPRQ